MEEVIRATLFRTGLGYDPGTVQGSQKMIVPGAML